MSEATEPLPGTADLLPAECQDWQTVEAAARALFARYGYGEIRTPVMERTEIFRHSLGDDTDVVQKEMYTFADRGGRSLTLRPEGTAGVLRALAHAGIPQGEEWRVYYLGPMFRGERPAAGRRRQFHQVGAECVGKTAAGFDVECIVMLLDLLAAVPVGPTRLLLNTRGTAADRPPVAAALGAHFQAQADRLCPDCQRRLQTNVWRILDCKVESCRPLVDAAPRITDLLGQASRDYFADVCRQLTALGVPYELEPKLVRGLDYYEHTVFEVVADGIGAQNALAGGGRYRITPPDGRPAIPGVGFAAGLERLLLARAPAGAPAGAAPAADIYLVSLNATALSHNMRLARVLRRQGQRVVMDLEGRGLRAQLRSANKLQAPVAYLLGEDELARGIIVRKDMRSGEQRELPLTDVLPA